MITEKALDNQQKEQQAHDQEDLSLSFEDLLDQFEPELPQRGELVEGEILQLDGNIAFVNVGAKRTAIIPPQDLDLLDDAILESLSVGDVILLYVLHSPRGDEDLLVSLKKGLEYQDWLEAKEYLANEDLLELEVVGYNKGGLLVAFRQLRGFIPNSHVPQLQYSHDRQSLMAQRAKMVGQELPLKVIEVDRQRRRLVLSAKAAQKEVRQQRLAELEDKTGEVITGRVTNVVDFGAFVDLGGVEGLVHKSEVAWQMVDDPGEHLVPGQEIDVLLMSVDIERERVSLSRKALLPNPWYTFAEEHHVGELLEGVVTAVLDFGAFVLVADKIEGLLHVSEIRGPRDAKAEDILHPGDTVLVRIVSIEPERERLGLSQRRVTTEEELEWTWQQQRRAIAPSRAQENGGLIAAEG